MGNVEDGLAEREAGTASRVYLVLYPLRGSDLRPRKPGPELITTPGVYKEALTLRKSLRAVAALQGVSASHLARAAGCPPLLPQGGFKPPLASLAS